MNLFWQEAKKQHQNWFLTKGALCSLLIWPVLGFGSAYFAFLPFDLADGERLGFSSRAELLQFLMIGHFSMLMFWSLMQSAWQMGFERNDGTLETIFLSPVNKLTLMYARAASSVLQNVWMTFVFLLLAFIYWQAWHWSTLLALVVVFSTALCWGALLNVVFMFTRQAGLLFDICDDPMRLFAGTSLPVAIFPLWAKAISLLFPMSYALALTRDLITTQTLDVALLLTMMGVNVVQIAFTAWLLSKAEAFVRKHGSYQLY